MNKKGDAALTPRESTYLVGAIQLIAALVATQSLRFFGRRTLLLGGHIFMAVAHYSIGWASIRGYDGACLASILAFLFVY